jgi:hypothetical protein
MQAANSLFTKGQENPLNKAPLAASFACAVFIFLLAGFAIAVSPLLRTDPEVQTGSTVFADNGRDYSDLESIDGSPPDNLLIACDVSSNDRRALARAFNNGNVAATVTDESGASGGCYYRQLSFNADAHDTCIGRRSDGSAFGCGPNSRHPDRR